MEGSAPLQQLCIFPRQEGFWKVHGRLMEGWARVIQAPEPVENALGDAAT